MFIEKELEIFIPTYSRKEELLHTLETLFSVSSPVRNVNITVLDNHSLDGTEDILKIYQKKYPNFAYIRHSRNIGGNANIACIFGLPKKAYFWMICDDDIIDFTCFNEVLAGIENQQDCIVVNHEYLPANNIAELYRLLTFLPAGIYKTSLLTDSVLLNAYNNIPNWFPHLALPAAIINKKGSFFICSENIVIRAGKESNYKLEMTKDETFENKSFPVINHILPGIPKSSSQKTLSYAYLNSCELIEAVDERISCICANGKSVWTNYYAAIQDNWQNNGGYLPNFCSLFSMLNAKNRLIFICCFLRSLLSVTRYIISYRKKQKNTEKQKSFFKDKIHD